MSADVLIKTKNALVKKIEELREAIESTKDEIRWLQEAPRPLDDVLPAIDAFIAEALDSELNPGIEFFFSPQFRFKHNVIGAVAKAPLDSSISVVGDAVVRMPNFNVDLSEFALRYFPEVVKARLIDDAKAWAANTHAGPPVAERPGLLDDAYGRLYDLELAEEKLICQCEDNGWSELVYRRADAPLDVVFFSLEAA